MRGRFSNFMSGRYGMDDFGRFLNIVTMAIILISFVGSFFFWFFSFFWYVGLILMIYSYFRMFSRNFAKRSAENDWYCRVFKRKNTGYNGYGQNYYNNSYGSANRGQAMTNEQKKAADKRTHKIYKCPNCAQKIRVPKGKGKICIKCPTCRIEFIKRT